MIATHHAQARMRQRAIDQNSLALVCTYGTEVRGGYLMTRRDAAALDGIAFARASQLVGFIAAVDGDCVKTAYRARPKQARRMLRRRRDNH
ncbi:hypothetical protein [Parvularcula oceani]|uniref:hypothetical protein n=1 Tax=Parvularcula oceani TaxID=1247963 RepID=UPI0004E1D214|nr:hypothetical protein [Parvularcula oceani]